MAEFEQLPPARWTVAGRDAVTFPVTSVREDGANRLVEHERPYREGAKLDDTGTRAKRWVLSAVFNNTIEEEDLNAEEPLYPITMNKLLAAFDEHETGDLVIPTRGTRRCRALSYSRTDEAGVRDEARIDLTFVEDNEDGVDQRKVQSPRIKATIVRLAEETQFTSQKEGVWDEDIADLTVLASQLEGLLLAPGRALDDIGAQVRRNRRAIQRVIDAEEKFADDAGGSVADPAGSQVVRELRLLLDRQAQATEERASGRPRTRTITVRADTTIYGVAAQYGQDADELLDLNSARISDPLDIRQGDSVRIYERTP